MAEHLDAQQFALRALDLLLHDVAMDGCHLAHVQLPRQDDDVRKTCVEAQGGRVSYIKLGR